VEKFLKAHPDWQLEDQKTVFPDETRNGFYMARLSRKPADENRQAEENRTDPAN